MYTLLTAWIFLDVNFKAVRIQEISYTLSNTIVDASCIFSKNYLCWIRVGCARRSLAAFLCEEPGTSERSSLQKLLLLTNSLQNLLAFTTSSMCRPSRYQNAKKSGNVLIHWIQGLVTEVTDRITLLALLSGMSQKYDAKFGKRFTHKFHPTQPPNPLRKLCSRSDKIINIALCSILIFISLLFVGEIVENQSRTSTTAEEVYPYTDSAVSGNAFSIIRFSGEQSTERKATKLCPLLIGHRLYASRKI